MARYTVRVLLHGAEELDYDALHEEMDKAGFKRTIVSENGTTYALPPAEYNRITTLDGEAVLDAAERAAAKTRKKYSILLSESTVRRWVGLDTVD